MSDLGRERKDGREAMVRKVNALKKSYKKQDKHWRKRASDLAGVVFYMKTRGAC